MLNCARIANRDNTSNPSSAMIFSSSCFYYGLWMDSTSLNGASKHTNEQPTKQPTKLHHNDKQQQPNRTWIIPVQPNQIRPSKARFSSRAPFIDEGISRIANTQNHSSQSLSSLFVLTAYFDSGSCRSQKTQSTAYSFDIWTFSMKTCEGNCSVTNWGLSASRGGSEEDNVSDLTRCCGLISFLPSSWPIRPNHRTWLPLPHHSSINDTNIQSKTHPSWKTSHSSMHTRTVCCLRITKIHVFGRGFWMLLTLLFLSTISPALWGSVINHSPNEGMSQSSSSILYYSGIELSTIATIESTGRAFDRIWNVLIDRVQMPLPRKRTSMCMQTALSGQRSSVRDQILYLTVRVVVCSVEYCRWEILTRGIAEFPAKTWECLMIHTTQRETMKKRFCLRLSTHGWKN